MRNDIRQGAKIFVDNNVKPNYAALARQYNVDYRTAKRAYLEAKAELTVAPVSRKSRPSLLDDFKEIIEAKLELNCSIMSIFRFIQKRGFTGQYTIVKDYCRTLKAERVHKATIRVEHTPGLSAQVDWKEEMTLYSRDGKLFHFNIFLYVLPYSKLKYITLVFDRKQDTLFKSLDDAFANTGGVPNEIWFDNMKQVVDHHRGIGAEPVLNDRFNQFCRDAGYKPIICRVFRPQTKGVVEALARTVERLRPYNYEFADGVELINLVDDLNDDLNHEVSQATDEIPIFKFEAEEKKYLHPWSPNLLDPFFEENITRVVSKESMVNFRKCKYSVDPQYIGRKVDIDITDDEQHIHIYYNGQQIQAHNITTKKYNYDHEDEVKILGSDLLKGRSREDIEAFIAENLEQYDEVGE